MDSRENSKILDNLLNKYSIIEYDQNEIKKMVIPIIEHPEFQLRMSNLYSHHGKITLGEHIIEDSIVTYLLSQKQSKKKYNYRIDIAMNIAMFHDLYTIPWQNNSEAKVNHFFHKHGFRHPIEAVINAISWYPEYFKSQNDAKMIIDGILHHMYPLPVMSIVNKKIDYYELKNMDLYNNLPSQYQKMIIDSLKRKRIGSISISKSRYMEGRIMAKADRIVSRQQIKSFQSMKSLITGHNKELKSK